MASGRSTVLALVLLPAMALAQDGAWLEGAWREGDRGSELVFRADGAGRWSGITRAAPRASEIGKVVFEGLRVDGDHLRGTLIRPEDGSRHEVRVERIDATTARAVVGVWPLSKTITLTRVAERDGGR